MISANKISVGEKLAGRPLVDKVSLEVRGGEMLAILGPNGAGKTTLLRLLCNEMEPQEGSILLHGKQLHEYDAAELSRNRAVLSQHNTISLSFEVDELILMGRYPHFNGRPGDKDFYAVHHAMEETGILHLSGRSYNTLSGGEQQRVQLARVLAQIYDVPGACLFLDEPTNNLDLLHQQYVLRLARKLADNGYCVVTILHDINLAGRFADNVLMMKQGRAIALGDPLEVLTCEIIHEVFNIQVKLMHCEEFRCPLVVPVN